MQFIELKKEAIVIDATNGSNIKLHSYFCS